MYSKRAPLYANVYNYKHEKVFEQRRQLMTVFQEAIRSKGKN